MVAAARRAVILLAAAMAIGPVAVAAQGLPSASVEAIMAGARSCLAATSATALDEAKLRADGWRQATMTSNGKPVANGLVFYSRDNLLLIVNHDGKTPLCAFTARIASVQEFPKLQAAVAAVYGAPSRDDGKGEQIFFTNDHHILDLASTGSQERPAVRVAIGPVPQETQ